MNTQLINRFTTLGIAALAAIASFSAQAHKLNMFAYIESDKVFVEGYFTDGVKPKNSDVTVSRLDGTVIASGKTDEAGAFVFDITDRNGIKVVLNAGMGHQTEYVLTAVELGAGSSANAAPPTPSPNGPRAAGGAPAFNEDGIRRAVAEAVKPLAKEIDALKNKTRFSDIIGGLGLIIGLLGGFAYYKANQSTRRPND